MLRSPLQRLKNEHVECSLQQLNPVLILVFFAHRCRHPTPNGGRSSTSFCTAQQAASPTQRIQKHVSSQDDGDSALARNCQCIETGFVTRCRPVSRFPKSGSLACPKGVFSVSIQTDVCNPTPGQFPMQCYRVLLLVGVLASRLI